MIHHGAGLRRLLSAKRIDDPEQESIFRALFPGPMDQSISPTDQAMLEYALKLTDRPGEILEGDVVALREAGFDDRTIHDICAITAYFAFANRIADGLGVKLEDESS